jgi:hypothetical protein
VTVHACPGPGLPARQPGHGYARTIPPKPRSFTRIWTLLMIMPVQHGLRWSAK